MSSILSVQGLHKKYPSFCLDDVSFELPYGYIMGFIGPNGAGKTTTLKAIFNMIHYDAGQITLFGDSNATMSSMSERVGIVMDATLYNKDWTAVHIESALRPFYAQWNSDRYWQLLNQYGIEAKKKIRELSRGMNVKLMLAVALCHNAELLILDEPTSGLDPVSRDELMDLLLEFVSDERHAVLFSTHITSDLERVADFITFIRSGSIVFTGEKDDLMNRYRIVKGGPDDLTASLQHEIIGLREYSAGFEGLIPSAAINSLSTGVITQPPTMDELVVYLNKEEIK